MTPQSDKTADIRSVDTPEFIRGFYSGLLLAVFIMFLTGFLILGW